MNTINLTHESLVLQYIATHEEREEQLVFLKERSADVDIEQLGKVVCQRDEPYLDVIIGFRVVNGIDEQVNVPRGGCCLDVSKLR